MAKQQLPPFALRIAPELRETLEKLADKNHRSLTGEILHRLEVSIEEEIDPRLEAALRSIISEEIRKKPVLTRPD